MKSLIYTYLSLLGLLALTVIASEFDLGTLQTPVALSIALAKTLLVAFIFMELSSSSIEIRLVAGAGLLWIFFFYFLSALDIGFRVVMPGSTWL
jgi:caa(3)-type oxidase subunit IV